ncbi:MAG TPA: phospholipase D-like domain-containing protein [Patescibacteria group bacterium]|nr:phospholipase D-like domain-containing protein [Patescibacteria group bacterium]
MKSTRNVVVLLIMAVVLVFLAKFGGIDVGEFLPEVAVPTESPVPGITPETGGDQGEYFRAYFTKPPEEGPGIEQHLIELVGSAEVSVHVASYEMDLESVADALIAAHDRGLDVKLVYDNEMVDDEGKELVLARLKAAGIPMVPDERSAFMHNKFFVIDGKTVWTGSFNYTENASQKNNENAVVFFVPELAANYEREFAELFAGEFGPTSTSDTPYPTFSFAGIPIENYFAPEDGVLGKVIAAVKGARYSVDFLAFSFTDADLGYTVSELVMEEDIALRGVFESRGNMEYSVCPYLMSRRGNIPGSGTIDLRLDGNPATMHEKVMVVDGETVIFGSFNFSRNAEESNDENLLIVHDPDLAALFTAEFEKVYSQGVVPDANCKSQ